MDGESGWPGRKDRLRLIYKKGTSVEGEEGCVDVELVILRWTCLRVSKE